MLRINARGTGDVMILDLNGRIAAGAAEGALGERVRTFLSRGCRNLLLNLADADSAGSAGVSALLDALLAAREVGGDVRLIHVMRGMTDLLVIVALYNYFSVFDSEKDAVASFRSTAPALAAAAINPGQRRPSGMAAA